MKTAFTTRFGLHQFHMMPLGLQGAPAMFQQLMDQLLVGLDIHMAPYLDDLVIFSKSWREHMDQVRKLA